MTAWLRARKIELIALIVASALVVIDQVSKAIIAANFALGESLPVIENVLHFTYIRNDGAVFGSFSGMPYIFNTVTVIVVVAALTVLLSGRLGSSWLKWTTALIISGGVGNMIDRFRLKYVVDFIDVRCFGKLWVWVFNIADCCVVIGCIMLLIYFTLEMINDAKKKRADEKGTDDAEA